MLVHVNTYIFTYINKFSLPLTHTAYLVTWYRNLNIHIGKLGSACPCYSVRKPEKAERNILTNFSGFAELALLGDRHGYTSLTFFFFNSRFSRPKTIFCQTFFVFKLSWALKQMWAKCS